MIAIKADLQGIEETVTRPIIITAVNDIKGLLGIGSDVYTFFDNKDNLFKRKTKDGGIIGDNSDRGSYIKIEHEENSEDGNELSLIPARPDFLPVYKDEDVGSSFQPIHHSRRINMHVKYAGKSRSKIFSIANKLKLYTSSDAMYCLHDFEYHYNIPNFLNKLLIEINNKKNYRIIDGDKLTIEQYIDQTFDDRVDFANALDGDITKSSLVIREKQLDIEGWVEGDLQSIKPEYDDQGSVWYIEFDYTFTYEKPVTLLVKYPILVYNSLIHPAFRTTIYEKPKKDNRAIRTGRAQAMHDATNTEQDPNDPLAIKHPNYYIPVPDYDTTKLPTPLNYYARLCVILTVIDDMDTKLLFNINDIPGIKFRDSYKEFIMNSERPYIGDEFKSIFHFELWKNNKKDYQNKIIMEEDGTLKTLYNLDYKYSYRVSINLLTDLSLLTQDAKRRIKAWVAEQIKSNITTTSLDKYKVYWQNANFQKMKRDLVEAIAKDNFITDWISITQPNINILNNVLTGNLITDKTSDYFDVALKLTKLNNKLRTVQISKISAMFEKK